MSPMKFSRIESTFIYRHRYVISITFLLLTTLFSQWWRIGSLVPGISQLEAASGLTAYNFNFNSLVDAPYYLVQKFFLWLPLDLALQLRAATMVFGLATAVAFFFTMRYWYSLRAALAGSFLFATSSWLLHASRLGAPVIMSIFWLVAITLAVTCLWRNRNTPFWYIATGLIMGLSLYTPRMIYLVIFVAVIGFVELYRRPWLGKRRKYGSLMLATALLVSLPLFFTIVMNPSEVFKLLGMPADGVDFRAILGGLRESVLSLFWKRPVNPLLGITRLPRLDIVSITMALLGLMVFTRDWRSQRSRLLLSLSLITVLIAAIGGKVEENYFILIIPVYIFITLGLHNFLGQWNITFPRNPVARLSGLLPVLLIVLLVGYYQLSRYYVAWAQVPETAMAFSQVHEALPETTGGYRQKGFEQIVYVTKPELEVAELSLREDKKTKVELLQASTDFDNISGKAVHFTEAAHAELLPKQLETLGEPAEKRSDKKKEIPAVITYTGSNDTINDSKEGE